MLSKRICFWTLLIVAVALSVFWMVHLPFDRERLCAAIPEDAVVVTRHLRLDERWPLLAHNPAVARLAAAFGAHSEDVAAVLSDPAIPAYLHRLVGRETVIAWSQPARDTVAETITVASWVGTTGQLLRWGLLRGALSDFELTRMEDGSRLWQYRDPALGARVVSLCVFEGVAVACLSRDAVAAARCRRRMAMDAPAIAPLNPRLPDVICDRDADTPSDRVWMRGARGEWTGSAQITRWSTDALAGQVQMDSDLLPAGHLSDGDADRIGRLVGNRPDTLLMTTWGDICATLRHTAYTPAVSNVCGALEGIMTPDAPVFAALLSGRYSGRVMRLRVPSVVLGFRCNGTNEPLRRAETVLDTLNASLGWGLIPKRERRADVPFVALDSIRSNGLGLFAPEERPAFAVLNDWLIIGSNARVLEALLVEDGEDRGSPPSWVHRFPSGGTAAFGWSRTAPTADSITKVKAVTALGMMLKHTQRYTRLRPAFDDAQKWIDAFGVLGECAVSGAADNRMLSIHWELVLDGS